jgi:dienelactone hydrolase
MRSVSRVLLGLAVTLALTLACAFTLPNASAQTQELNAALSESIHRVEVQVADRFNKQEAKSVVITSFKPLGAGPFPLLILNHGRATANRRHTQGRQRFVEQARWFVERGFAVLVPTRIGYGETYSDFDPEDSDACRSPQLAVLDEAMMRQTLAVLEFARTQRHISVQRWLLAGQSVGGYLTVSVARRAPPGLAGAINFAGGYGGNPESRRGSPCGAWAWERSLASPGHTGKVPMLWLYWDDDWYWGNEIPKRWFDAYRSGGGIGEFVAMPAIQGDGHAGFRNDLRNWSAPVEKFVGRLGLR